MSWQQCQLWMFTCFLFLWRLCCELNQTIALDTKITANTKCMFSKLAKFPDIVHSMVPQIIDLARQKGSCTEESRWAWGSTEKQVLTSFSAKSFDSWNHTLSWRQRFAAAQQWESSRVCAARCSYFRERRAFWSSHATLSSFLVIMNIFFFLK